MKKRLLVMMMVTALSIPALAGCGGRAEDTRAPSQDTGEASANTGGTAADTGETSAGTAARAAESEAEAGGDAKAVKIGWLQKNQSNAFEVVINTGGEAVLEELKASGEIEEYYLLDGQTDASLQVSQASDLINLGVDAIIMQSAEADGSAPVVDIAHEADIPIVLVNALTSNADSADGISASDDVNAGEILANFVIDKLGDTGKYCHLQGVIGNTAAIQRTEGIHNVMDQQKGWELLEEQSAEWLGDKASKFTQDWIALYGDELDAIVCDNDDMAVASKLACIEAGREDIVVIGVDATDAALAMVADGELDGTVFQDGTNQGAEAVRKAVALAKGEEAERETWIPFQLVTSENIDEFYPK